MTGPNSKLSRPHGLPATSSTNSHLHYYALLFEYDLIMHASLVFVAKVFESPLIADGVYNFEIVVDYCLRELATDLLRFGKHRAIGLIFQIRIDMEEIEFNGEDDETTSNYPYEDYQQTIDYSERLRSVWMKYAKTADKGTISLEYLHLLLQGHQEYIQKHEEQFQLITDGSFVERFTSAMT
ncbi:hypothetical protein ACLOAV_003247 [Pseudogymnoascus australis]